MADPAPPDPSHPEPGASLEAYKPYLALFGIATAGVALLVVVGGIALAAFMNAGWVLVPLACAIWTLFPLRELRELEDGAGIFEGAAPAEAGSDPSVAGPRVRAAGAHAEGVGGAGGTGGAGGARGARGAAKPAASGDATRGASAGREALAGGPGAGAPPLRTSEGRRAVWDVVRQRAVHALLITFTAWAALILLHLI